jgi:EF-hand domain pair
MTKVNNRSTMRKKIEEDTMKHIAAYIAKKPGCTIESLFNEFETDGDGCIDINELTVMFRSLQINVNNQLLRILLAIFDKNDDQKINIDEFTSLLNKYVDKSQVDNTKTTKDKLVVNFNDVSRKVYEDYNFDHNDVRVIQKRDQQAIALVRSGEMPYKKIEGEI